MRSYRSISLPRFRYSFLTWYIIKITCCPPAVHLRTLRALRKSHQLEEMLRKSLKFNPVAQGTAQGAVAEMAETSALTTRWKGAVIGCSLSLKANHKTCSSHNQILIFLSACSTAPEFLWFFLNFLKVPHKALNQLKFCFFISVFEKAPSNKHIIHDGKSPLSSAEVIYIYY